MKKNKKKKVMGISTATEKKVRRKWPDRFILVFLHSETKGVLFPCPKCGSKNVAVLFDPTSGAYFGNCIDCDYDSGEHSASKEAVKYWNSWGYSLLYMVVAHDHPLAIERQNKSRVVGCGKKKGIKYHG